MLGCTNCFAAIKWFGCCSLAAIEEEEEGGLCSIDSIGSAAVAESERQQGLQTSGSCIDAGSAAAIGFAAADS